MKFTHNSIKRFIGKGIAFTLLPFLFINCSESDSVSSSSDLYQTEDAAEAVASNVSTESGGATDQMADLSTLASEDGLDNLSKSLAKTSGVKSINSIDTSYNETTGEWTISMQYDRSIPQRSFTASFSRTYTVQYLKEGTFQKYYITNGDTANTIMFNIVDGQGSINSIRLAHRLNNLSGSWVATNVQDKVMGVAGTYTRAATDTFTTRNAVKTFDYTLTLEFAGVTIPTKSSEEVPALIAGGMSGNFTADITITRGDETSEKSIDKSFAVLFAAKSFGLTLDGEEFTADTESGELQ